MMLCGVWYRGGTLLGSPGIRDDDELRDGCFTGRGILVGGPVPGGGGGVEESMCK